jgi:hypothetical protein
VSGSGGGAYHRNDGRLIHTMSLRVRRIDPYTFMRPPISCAPALDHMSSVHRHFIEHGHSTITNCSSCPPASLRAAYPLSS